MGVHCTWADQSMSDFAAIVETNLTSVARAIDLVLPGDVDSEFLRLRPVQPDEGTRARMLSPDDVARAVQFVLDAPPGVTIDELVISPTGF